ncbi:hypothetical protein [Enterobacter cloacae]
MGQVNERREGIHIQLAQIIFIITFFVYLLKLNVLCRKNKGESVRQMKEVFFICGVNITVMKVPVQGIAEPV